MELTQLRYFQAAAEECNFTRAAKRLNISQPALSKSIGNLEEELEVELFVRDGNRLALSSFGETFLNAVNAAVLHLDEGVKKARSSAGLDSGNVFVAVSEAITIANLIEKFLLDYPDVHFREIPASTLQMENSLMDGSIDFGVTYERIRNPKILWQPLYHDRMSVLLPHNHPLAGRKSIRMEELVGERIVQGDNFGRPNTFWQDYNNDNFVANTVYEGTNKSMVGRLVRQGTGIAFAPLSVTFGRKVLRDFGDEDVEIACVPLEDDFWHKTVGIVSLRDHQWSKAAAELLTRIKNYYASMPPAFP